MSTKRNKWRISLTLGTAFLPVFTSPFYAKEIQKTASEKKVSPSNSYWLHATVPDEGLCGGKMQPNVPLITLEAENGNAFAAFRLGQLHRSGLWGVTKDLKRSLYWFERAASGGQRSAIIILGQAYEFGRLNLKKDFNKAIHYYKRANKIKHDIEIEERIKRLVKSMK